MADYREGGKDRRIKPHQPIHTTIHTEADLVHMLQIDPPLPFRGANMPFEDRRELVRLPHATNYFTVDAMLQMVTDIRLRSFVRPKRVSGMLDHFGTFYEGHGVDLVDELTEFRLGRQVNYIVHNKTRNELQPDRTVCLYGSDPENPFLSLGIEVTRYKNWVTDEVVDVYRTKEPADRTKPVFDMLEEIDSPDDITTSQEQSKVTVSVGDIGWTESFQVRVLKAFGLIEESERPEEPGDSELVSV